MPTLEERIQRLEDIEAIRRLKRRYARLVDAHGSAQEYAALFTEDAVKDPGPLGTVIQGRKAIEEYFDRAKGAFPWFLHFLCGETIDVESSGTEAAGHWYLWEPATLGDQAVWIAITYDERYRKVGGQWYFAYSKLNFHFMTPYDQGWVKQRFAAVG